MFPEVQAVLFDLDGTLVDSAPDLALAVGEMMRQLGRSAPTEMQVRHWVGNGAERLLHRALSGEMHGQVEAVLADRARPLFMAAYERYLCERTQLYPGVLEGLQQLHAQGLPMACVTNKPSRFAIPLIERIGLSELLPVVVGGDCTAQRKPAPDALLLAAERLGCTASQLLMVGDSVNDIEAARNAGCPVVAVPYGYNHGRDIVEHTPDCVVSSLAELPALLRRVA